MKKYYGIIIVLTFLLIWIFWCFEALSKPVYGYRGYSQLIASTALITFTWIFYISTRHRLIDKIFYGLHKSYIYHKYLSIMAIVLIWVHIFTGLVIFFLITYKLNYERWKLIHKLILVPYVFGLIHYYPAPITGLLH